MEFSLTYGTDVVVFTIGDNCLSEDLPVISPRILETTDKMEDIEGSIKAALENPMNSGRLKDMVGDKRVGLVVSDEFRSGQQEMILRCMLAEISKGDPKEVRIFCATGSHAPEIYAKKISEWANRYSEQFGLQYKFFANDCDGNNFTMIGSCADGTPIEIYTELLRCDVRAYGHEGKHHYMCGYSNIDKQLLPGLSSRRSIEGNHKNALDDIHSFAGRSVWSGDPDRQENPFALGVYEARKAADSTCIDENGKLSRGNVKVFGLDMISDKKHIYWAAAGDTSVITREMVKKADEFAAFSVTPVKYVVISPGGPPASQTIYSTQNCFDMALSGAILDGGEALIVAPCDGRPDIPEDTRGLAPGRKSKKLFYDNLSKMKDWPIEKAEKWIRENFELYLWKTDRVLKLMNRRNIKLYLHSTLPDEKVRAAGFMPVKDVQAWIDERAQRNDSSIRVIDQGNKILVKS